MTPAERTDPATLLAHTAGVQRLARALTRNAEFAEDAVQETLAAALESTPSESPSLGPWLAGVARNWIAKARRTRRRRMDVEWRVAREEVQPSTQDLVIRAELHRELMAAVLALEERQREAILLRYLENLAPREIAARLKLPVRTVNTRLARGLVHLREELDRNGGRERWLGAFLLLGRGSSELLPFGILAMKTKLAAAAVLLLLLTWLGVRSLIERDAAGSPAPSVASAPSIEAPLREPEAASESPAPTARETRPRNPGADGRLTVSLATSDGMPVPAAQLALFRGEELLATCATDAAGLAYFASDAGSGEIFVLAPNWAPARAAVDLGPGNRTVTLQDGATLGGKVLVLGSTPPEPIELEFETDPPPLAIASLPKKVQAAVGPLILQHGLQYAVTDSNGAFLLRGLPADAAGRLEWREPWFLDSGDAFEIRSLAVDAPANDIELHLTRGMELAMRVVDPAGAAVSNAFAVVKILSQEFRSVSQHNGKTDSDGRFRCSLGNEPPTGVEVRIRREDGSGAVTRTLTRPAEVRGVWDAGDLALAATRTIRVHVEDQDGAPIESALAVPLPSKATTGGARSDANGDFEQTLAIDDTQIMAQAVGYESALVDVPPDATRVEATLAKACMLEFTILGAEGVDLRYHRIRVACDPPMFTDESPSALPALQDPYGGRGLPEVDARRPYSISLYNFPYRIAGLMPGKELEAAVIYTNGPPLAEARIAPLAAGEHRKVELTLTRRPKSLRVRVLAADQSPVAAAQVHMGVNHSNAGRTDASGTFVIDSIYEEQFTVTVEAGGLPTKVVRGVSIPPDELTIVLDTPRTLEVELIQSDGSPFTDQVEVSAGQDELSSMQQGKSVGGGRWRVSNLPAGEVIVRAGNARMRAVTLLHDMSEPSVRIVVGQPGSVLARVSEAAALSKDSLWMALRAEGESRAQRRVKFESSRLGGLVGWSEGLAFGSYDVWLETRDPAPPCDWIRIGAPQRVVLDAEHARAEIELAP